MKQTMPGSAKVAPGHNDDINGVRIVSVRVANIIEEGKLGGPQIRIMRVAATLQDRVETTVIMPQENSEAFRAKCDAAGIPYKTFKMSRITKEWRVALRYLLFFLLDIIRLSKCFSKGGYDLVHVSGGSWQYKGIIAGKVAGKKVVWHLNDTSMPWVFRQLFVLFSRFSDGYIFASQKSREYYGSALKYNKPEVVIPAPVVTADFVQQEKYSFGSGVPSRWSGKVIIGTVANVNPIKGLDVFIGVAARVNQFRNNVVFVVVGPVHRNQRKHYESLRRTCEDGRIPNVEFVGGMPDPRPLLARFDIYLCTSYAESSPLSVWEAMSMGKAIVSTNVGDVPLYVRNGESGEIAEIGAVDGLAEKILMLINDSPKRSRYGEKARKIAVNELDVSICARKHIDIYRAVCMNVKKEAPPHTTRSERSGH